MAYDRFSIDFGVPQGSCLGPLNIIRHLLK